MSQVRIVPGEPQEPYSCPCCSKLTGSSHGMIYLDDQVFAAYFALWTVGNRSGGVSLALSCGTWEEDSDPTQRRTVTLNCHRQQTHLNFHVTDAGASLWKAEEKLGKLLNREEALAEPQIHEIYHAAEHVMWEDPTILRFLNCH